MFTWSSFLCDGGLVAKLCLTLATPWTVALQAPVHGILQARMLEWGAISLSRDLPDPEVEQGSPGLHAGSLLTELQREVAHFICV